MVGGRPDKPSGDTVTPEEFRRPWAYPFVSPGPNEHQYFPTPTELYDATKPGGDEQPDGTPLPDTMHLLPGPYPKGVRPDQVFFRTDQPVDPEVRASYESARTPRETDWLNQNHLFQGRMPTAPLGDPIPLSIYLIGRLANPTGYQTQFNLDSDRAYGYLTWDWIRNPEDRATNDGILVPPAGLPIGLPTPVDYAAPDRWPLLSEDWDGPDVPMELEYVDRPIAGVLRAGGLLAREGGREADRPTPKRAAAKRADRETRDGQTRYRQTRDGEGRHRRPATPLPEGRRLMTGDTTMTSTTVTTTGTT